LENEPLHFQSTRYPKRVLFFASLLSQRRNVQWINARKWGKIIRGILILHQQKGIVE